MPTLDLVGLVVADMSASLAFYRELGLAFPPGSEGEGHVETTLPSGLRLALDTIETIQSFDPEWTPPSGSSRASLAFRCADPSEVDATFQRLVDRGHAGHREPWDAFWGQRYAVLHDPDGNSVDLFAGLDQ